MTVGIQGQQESRSFLDNPHTSVTAAVKAALVALGKTKPTFQVKIVLRQIDAPATGKQTRGKTGHQFAHVQQNRIRLALLKSTSKLLESTAALGATGGSGIQRTVHRLNLLDVTSYLVLRPSHQVDSAIDTFDQPTQKRFRDPPFFRRMFRANDRRTSFNALHMRSPGGCRGPP